MSNIAITHSPAGLIHAEVVRTERVTPHMIRVTLGGGDLARFDHRGFDQWFRLAIPVTDSPRFDNLPQRFGLTGYLRYLTLPKGTRPVFRNYTVRAFRPEKLELDVDFVAHGTEGVAAGWAASVEKGVQVAFIDQGCGWQPVPADWTLLAADETGLPAVAGILRDLPRDSVGHAIIELFDDSDRQPLDAPGGIAVQWVLREPNAAPGSAALPALRDLVFPEGLPYAFAVGESALATGTRRHLLTERNVPKGNVTFSGYWKRGPSH